MEKEVILFNNLLPGKYTYILEDPKSKIDEQIKFTIKPLIAAKPVAVIKFSIKEPDPSVNTINVNEPPIVPTKIKKIIYPDSIPIKLDSYKQIEDWIKNNVNHLINIKNRLTVGFVAYNREIHKEVGLTKKVFITNNTFVIIKIGDSDSVAINAKQLFLGRTTNNNFKKITVFNKKNFPLLHNLIRLANKNSLDIYLSVNYRREVATKKSRNDWWP